jgi:hypothetical protein
MTEADKFNSAQRVHDILLKARGMQPAGQAFEIWAKVFDIQVDNGYDKQYRVVEMLSTLREEVLLARAAASHTNIKPIRYSGVFDAINDMLSLHNFVAAFENTSRSITPEVLSMLGVLADIIQNDGVPFNKAELDDLVSQLETIERDLESKDLPEDIRRFFLSQVRILLRAIRRYPVAGNKAFHEALGDFFAAVAQAQETANRAASDEQAQETFDKLQKIWIWCMSRANDVATVLTLVDYGRKFLGGA